MSDVTDFADPKKADSVVGVKPWLPWPLSRSRWWTAPAPAERLAVLRIGMAALLLLDVLLVYLPNGRAFFGRGSLGRPEVFESVFKPSWDWDTVGEDVK